MNDSDKMKTHRSGTRQLYLGSIPIGGGAPIVIQSMTNTDTRNIEATLKQITDLHNAGCDVIRVAVLDESAADALKTITTRSPLPVIADIHFHHVLALKAIENGIAGLRLNPGNIQNHTKVQEIVAAAREKMIPIRIGVNAGSVNRKKYGDPTPESLVASALEHITILEKLNYYNIKISLKMSDVSPTVAAYRLMAQKRNYPLHLGITEAGTVTYGSIKSAMGIGALLIDGIGDTIRVSLAGDPVQEIIVAQHILRAAGLYTKGVEIIACPTCGRTTMDVAAVAEELERRTKNINARCRIAVMGCVVNGPGEAKDADIAVVGHPDGVTALIYCNGKQVNRIQRTTLYDETIHIINDFISRQ